MEWMRVWKRAGGLKRLVVMQEEVRKTHGAWTTNGFI
jgi:hypothetical protein